MPPHTTCHPQAQIRLDDLQLAKFPQQDHGYIVEVVLFCLLLCVSCLFPSSFWSTPEIIGRIALSCSLVAIWRTFSFVAKVDTSWSCFPAAWPHSMHSASFLAFSHPDNLRDFDKRTSSSPSLFLMRSDLSFAFASFELLNWRWLVPNRHLLDQLLWERERDLI